MTNAEIVATWMERKPVKTPRQLQADGYLAPKWWVADGDGWQPVPMTGDRLSEARLRLQSKERTTINGLTIHNSDILNAYHSIRAAVIGVEEGHPTPEQLLEALGSALGPLVEAIELNRRRPA